MKYYTKKKFYAIDKNGNPIEPTLGDYYYKTEIVLSSTFPFFKTTIATYTLLMIDNEELWVRTNKVFQN